MEWDHQAKEGFLRRRIARPILELLGQGVTPEKMALSLALGIALGVFPLLGTTTALCALAALILRLNLPAIQIVNYFVYPLQIALLIPFFRMGEKLFGAPHLPLSVTQILMDNDLACNGGMVLDRSTARRIDLRSAGAAFAARSAKNTETHVDRLKSVSPTAKRIR